MHVTFDLYTARVILHFHCKHENKIDEGPD